VSTADLVCNAKHEQREACKIAREKALIGGVMDDPEGITGFVMGNGFCSRFRDPTRNQKRRGMPTRFAAQNLLRKVD
jgi:hypothetical protein